MKALLLVGSIVFSVVFGGCAAQPRSSQDSPDATTAIRPSATQTAAPASDARAVTPADIASYQENVESTAFTYAEYESAPAALPAFIEAFNKMINYQPSDEELAKSKDLVSPVTGAAGPRAAAEKYRESFDGMFAKKGEFFQMLQATGASNFDKWLKTKEAGDHRESLYTMTFSLDEERRLVISSNVNKNSLPDDHVATVYTFSPNMKLVNPTPSNKDEGKRRWLWDEGILTRFGEVAKRE